MASGLLMLLDDIATVLDEVAVLTKVAAKNTAGILGDDLALNAQQDTGVKSNREFRTSGSLATSSIWKPSGTAGRLSSACTADAPAKHAMMRATCPEA